MTTYLTIFFGAALVTQLCTPWAARLANRLHAIDKPDARKVHRRPTPRLGGLAIIIGTMVLIIPAVLVDNHIGQALRSIQTQMLVLLLASAAVFTVGMLDDVRGLRAKSKLLVLLLAALVVYLAGGRITQIQVEGLFTINFGWLSLPLTMLWIIGITVSMNFIDGLDGLAAGIAAVTCTLIAMFAFYTQQIVMGSLMLAVVGSLTGFLFLNFNPARVFMGDCGSMFLGFLIASSSIFCTAKTFTLIGLALPAAAMGVPIMDTFFTLIRRHILERRSVFSAERGHIHHRLLDRGLNHRHAVLVIYGMTLLSAVVAAAMLVVRQSTAFYLLVAVLVVLLLLFHLAGSSRWGETLAALRRNNQIAQAVRQEQFSFDEMQLRVRASRTFEDWWQTLVDFTDRMGFDQVSLVHEAYPSTRHIWKWSRPQLDLGAFPLIRSSMPLRDESGIGQAYLDVAAQVNGSFETTGRRMMLLGRLLDEFSFQRARQLAVSGRSAGADGGSSAATEDSMGTITQSPDVPEPVTVLGVNVTPFASYVHAVDCVDQAIRTGQQHWWVAINPQKVHRALKEAPLREALAGADAGICDGIGVSIAVRLLHGKTLRRCTGCDLFFRLIEAAAEKGWRVYLLGASSQANDGAASSLRDKYPNLQIVGHRDGFFTGSQEASVISQINQSNPDIVFVAMGSPKQELWIARHRHEIQAAFLLGVGGTFDVASGLSRRAPLIFRKTGTEFLFQLITQPWRWKRQMVYFPYMLRVLRECLFNRGRSDRPDSVKAAKRPTAPVQTYAGARES